LIRLKKEPLIRHIPIIALIASVTSNLQEICLDAGMDDFSTILVSFSDLENNFKNWLLAKTCFRKLKTIGERAWLNFYVSHMKAINRQVPASNSR